MGWAGYEEQWQFMRWCYWPAEGTLEEALTDDERANIAYNWQL